jgi:hypothetical protein
MKIARIVRATAFAAAGALATAGAASAAPALNLGADTANTETTAATPVTHYGYGTPGYYHSNQYGTYYQPQYQPYYQPYYAPPPRPRYYGHPYGYNSYNGYNGYRSRPHGGVFIRTPGLRLGIGW